ncbi:molybdopterin converting factor subunit 1 [Chitinophaga lutea]
MKLLLFGIMKDIASAPSLTAPEDLSTVGALRNWLLAEYPAMARLRSVMIAVNKSYARDEQPLQPGDEIAVIPPLSGG